MEGIHEYGGEKKTRRDFLKYAALAGVALLGAGYLLTRKSSSSTPSQTSTFQQPEITSPEGQPEQGYSEPKKSIVTQSHLLDSVEVNGKVYKNIWTENPDYVGKKLEDFKMPTELLGDSYIGEGILHFYNVYKTMFGHTYYGHSKDAVVYNFGVTKDHTSYRPPKGSFIIVLEDGDGDGIIDFMRKVTSEKIIIDTKVSKTPGKPWEIHAEADGIIDEEFVPNAWK